MPLEIADGNTLVGGMIHEVSRHLGDKETPLFIIGIESLNQHSVRCNIEEKEGRETEGRGGEVKVL